MVACRGVFRKVSTKIFKWVCSRITTLRFINLCKTNLCCPFMIVQFFPAERLMFTQILVLWQMSLICPHCHLQLVCRLLIWTAVCNLLSITDEVYNLIVRNLLMCLLLLKLGWIPLLTTVKFSCTHFPSMLFIMIVILMVEVWPFWSLLGSSLWLDLICVKVMLSQLFPSTTRKIYAFLLCLSASITAHLFL